MTKPIQAWVRKKRWLKEFLIQMSLLLKGDIRSDLFLDVAILPVIQRTPVATFPQAEDSRAKKRNNLRVCHHLWAALLTSSGLHPSSELPVMGDNNAAYYLSQHVRFSVTRSQKHLCWYTLTHENYLKGKRVYSLLFMTILYYKFGSQSIINQYSIVVIVYTQHVWRLFLFLLILNYHTTARHYRIITLAKRLYIN